MTAEIEKYITIKDGKVYQKAFLNYVEREVGELNDEKTIEFYMDNFIKFKSEVDNLIAKIDSEENKGSFLSYLENLRNQITDVEGVGDFEILFKKINQYEVDINKQIRANRERNLAVKRGFIEELKELVKTDDTSLVVERVKDIKGKWIRVGAVDKDYQEDLNQTFEKLIDDFFIRYKEVISEELEVYTELVEESEELAKNEDIEYSKKRIIEIQKEWKLLPKIPKSEYVPLFKRLKESHDEFFSRLKEFHGSQKNRKNSEGNEKGLAEKKKLIEDAQQLLTNIESKSIKDLRLIQDNWKKSGRVSPQDNEELWVEFSTLCDEFFERKTLEFQVQKRKISGERDILNFKIKQLQSAIYSDKKNLQAVEDNLGAFRLNISSKKMENIFTNQDKSAERKIEVKNKILKDLKDTLNGLA